MDSSLSITARLSAGHERRAQRREERRDDRVEHRELRREDRQETIAQWKTQIAQMLYTAAPTTPAPAAPAPDLPATTEPVTDSDMPAALALPAGAYDPAPCHSQPALAVA